MAESLMLQEAGTQQSLAGQTGVDAERTLGEETVQGPCQLTLYLWALPSPFHPVPPPPIHFPHFQHIPVPHRWEGLIASYNSKSEAEGGSAPSPPSL